MRISIRIEAGYIVVDITPGPDPDDRKEAHRLVECFRAAVPAIVFVEGARIGWRPNGAPFLVVNGLYDAPLELRHIADELMDCAMGTAPRVAIEYLRDGSSTAPAGETTAQSAAHLRDIDHARTRGRTR